jgi:hypothetical protein
MLLLLNAVSISSSISANLGGEKSGSQIFSIDVHPVRVEVELQTGEIFRDPSEKFRMPAKIISGCVQVAEALHPDHLKYNRMEYIEAIGGHPSAICFVIYLPSDQYRELTSNIQSGFLPSTVTVYLVSDYRSGPITEGKWNNVDDNNRRVKIESISFGYILLKHDVDDDTDQVELKESVSQIATLLSREIQDQLLSIQAQLTSIRRETKELAGAVLLGSIIIAIAIIYFSKH